MPTKTSRTKTPAIVLTRQGKFMAPNLVESHSPTRCGRPGIYEFKYAVQLRCPSDKLDDKGFVIDNVAIQRYFDERYGAEHRFVSCERMAAEAVQYFRHILPHLTGVVVRIYGTPGAYIQIVWEA